MHGIPITRLFVKAGQHTKLFIQQETELLKAELSEKRSHFLAAGTKTATGAAVAYAAVLVLVAGLGALLTFAFQKLKLDLLPAGGAGFGLAGLLVVIIGTVPLLNAIKNLSREPFALNKTLYTIQRMKKNGTQNNLRPQSDKPKRSSKDLEAQVVATEQRLGRNLEALAARFSPTRHLRNLSKHVQARPVRWNLAALATGFAGSVWFVRKLRK